MGGYLLKNVNIVNEYEQYEGSIYIENGYIKKIIPKGYSLKTYEYNTKVIEGNGKFLIPGIIDEHVHFREPGLAHKGDIETESKAAVSGGITSFMEMPNTKPNAVTNEVLEKKYEIAEMKSWANYSFYLGATNENMEELQKIDPERVCGIKVFIGTSTGNIFVSDKKALENIFKKSPAIITAHCEDEYEIRKNLDEARKTYGDDIPINKHPEIRSEKACYNSSSNAKKIADKHKKRLHILHLSTAKELDLFESGEDPTRKNVTSEICIHHLWFNENDYTNKGTLIKWNPAIKKEDDRIFLLQAILDDRIDVIATDHAPHTYEEKQNNYIKAPSGGPMVQHSLLAMLEFYHSDLVSIEKIIQKMAHNPARIFQIKNRGFIREGYRADLVMIDLNKNTKVNKESLLYKCGWSPMEGYTFKSAITHTFVNGNLVLKDGEIYGAPSGLRLEFDR